MIFYVITADSGLNGHWMESVTLTQPTDQELAEMDRRLRMSGAPTGFGGYRCYEVDTDALDFRLVAGEE